MATSQNPSASQRPSRRNGPNSDTASPTERQTKAPRLPPCPDAWTDLIREIVDAAPPATAEQRAKLLLLLHGDRPNRRAAA